MQSFHSVIGSNRKIKATSSQKQISSRKIRCIKDFDSLNRSSLLIGCNQSVNCMENTKTKKLQKLDFLPKVALDSEGSKENSPGNNANNNHKIKKKNIAALQSTSNILQASFETKKEKCNDILLSLVDDDEEVNFKLKSKKKQQRAHKTTNELESTQNDTIPNKTTMGKFEYVRSSSLRKNILQKKNKRSMSTNGNNFLSKSITINNEEKQDNLNNSKENFHNLVSRSFQILASQITPDTSGNNQGLFDVTYPIEEDNISLVQLSSLELTFEKTKSNLPNNQEVNLNLHKQSSSPVKVSEVIETTVELDNDDKKVQMPRGSVINLITPSPKKLSVNMLFTPTPSKSTQNSLDSSEHAKTIPSLVRSGTFTKESKSPGLKSSLALLADPELSVFNRTKSSRKRWTKMFGISLLDNSGNIQPISAPSCNDLLNSPANSTNHSSTKQFGMSSPVHLSASTPVTTSKKENDLFKISNKKEIIKSIKKSKMPNFAQIHQKAFEKLENIKEMSERKAARAQKLLSGHKPEIGLIKHSPSKSRKALVYNSIQKQIVNYKPDMRLQIVKPFQVEPDKSNSKAGRNVHNINGKSGIPLPKHDFKSTSQNKMNAKKNSLENKGMTKHVTSNSISLVKKLPSEREHLKAIAAKKRIPPDNAEKRRKVVQNVRTNRRFELLMQMRKK